MDEDLIETYGALIVCPNETCGFIFEMKHCRTEEEGMEVLMAVARVHGRFAHGSTTYLDTHIQLVESTTITKHAEERTRMN